MKLNRRDFVRSLGISALSVPFLPQGIFKPLWGQSAPNRLKVFATFWVPHGGEYGRAYRPTTINQDLRFPTANTFQVRPDYNVKWDALNNFRRADNSLNSVFGPEWHNADMIRYLNFLQNLQVDYYWGHGYATLGNFNTDHNTNPLPFWKTLDHVVYQSPSYYKGDSPARHLFYSGNPRTSVSLSDPDNFRSSLVAGSALTNLRGVYSQIFMEPPTAQLPANRAAIDRVLLDLNALKVHPNLSRSDNELLDIHAGRLDRLKQLIQIPGCSPYPTAAFWDQTQFYYSADYKRQVGEYLANMIAFSASTCGRPFVFTTDTGEFAMSPAGFGDFHQEAIHYCSTPTNPIDERRNRLFDGILPWKREMISNTFYKLAAALRTTPNGTGGNLLDDSLLCLVPEAGYETHWSYALNMVTAGKAMNRLRTGNYVDFSDTRTTVRYQAADPLRPNSNLGLPYINLLNTICTAAGLPTSSYEVSSGQGFGFMQYPEFGDQAGQRPLIPFNSKVDWLLS